MPTSPSGRCSGIREENARRFGTGEALREKARRFRAEN